MATDLSPTMTVLDWLRGEARLTGTKEGCGEGDCGACTILLARPEDGVNHWQAVNSCLMPLAQLDGCAVMTVEGATPPAGLSGVQQALIDHDGTQCGFCTPGFVMAMTALAQENINADNDIRDADIHEALAGNLCRCTGYRAIVDACKTLPAAPPAPDLKALPPPDTGTHHTDSQRFFAPTTVDDLLTLRAEHPDAVLVAGGTDLGLGLSKKRQRWPVTISTARVAELRRVAITDTAISIGATATYTDAMPALTAHIPAFADLVRRIGSRQIRNLGTLAGNIATASPIGDTLPCLLALDASVEIRSRSRRRVEKIADFITGYRKTTLAIDEIIATVDIPIPRPDVRFAAYKLSKRFDQDISTVVAAFSRMTNGDGMRAAFGGMAATVARAGALEAALAAPGADKLSLAALEALLARDFAPMSDQRGSAAYRLRAAAGLARRFILETSDATMPLALEAL